MLRLTAGIFGNGAEELASFLGKKGTMNDISIHNHNSSEAAMNLVVPAGEKVQSLLQSIALADVPVVIIEELTPEIGELLIALDMFSFEAGFIISNVNIAPLVKGTSLEKYTLTTKEELRKELMKIDIHRKDSPVRVPIDNYFDVRNVGFIVLGIIKSGTVKKYDKLFIEPIGKEILVKSIQSNDKNIEEAEKGTRVGLNIKGVASEEMKRGYVVCDSMKKIKTIKTSFEKSKFSKEIIKPGDQIGVLSGLLFSTGTVKNITHNSIEIEFLREIPYDESTVFVFASTKNNLPRILGKGKI